MANDVDIESDIQSIESAIDGLKDELAMLLEIQFYRFIEYDEKKSGELKDKFQDKFGTWGGYY